MQNIDYSQRIRRFQASTVESGHAAPTVAERPESSLRNRRSLFYLVAALLLFAGGLFVGNRVTEMSHLDREVVRYPDAAPGSAAAATDSESVSGNGGNSNETTRFANVAGPVTSRNQATGSFIIRVGTYPNREAERIASKLNNLSELSDVHHLACKDVSETVPNRYPAFRTQQSESEQNVFVGCFAELESAREVYRAVQQSGERGVSRALLFEID